MKMVLLNIGLLYSISFPQNVINPIAAVNTVSDFIWLYVAYKLKKTSAFFRVTQSLVKLGKT